MRERIRGAAREATGAEELERLRYAVEDLQRSTDEGLAAIVGRLQHIAALLEDR